MTTLLPSPEVRRFTNFPPFDGNGAFRTAHVDGTIRFGIEVLLEHLSAIRRDRTEPDSAAFRGRGKHLGASGTAAPAQLPEAFTEGRS